MLDCAESGIERCTWNSGDAFAKKLDGGGLAEGAGLALEGHAHGLAVECGHKHGLSCNRRSKTRSKDCTGLAAEMAGAVPALVCKLTASACKRKEQFQVGLRLSQQYNFLPKERSDPMKRPEPTEYAVFYAGYVSKVPGSDALGVLESQRLQMLQLFAGRSERDGSFRYAPGKWTVKEVLGHITDTERIFTYRALRIARGDQTPLPGFEQEDFVRNGAFSERTLADLAEEFGLVRNASMALFRSFQKEAWLRRGVASQKEVTVRALAFITAGHQIHHRLILEERYFPAIPRA
jgi:uncharacterized damage-inducible protein DinB